MANECWENIIHTHRQADTHTYMHTYVCKLHFGKSAKLLTHDVSTNKNNSTREGFCKGKNKLNKNKRKTVKQNESEQNDDDEDDDKLKTQMSATHIHTYLFARIERFSWGALYRYNK